MNRFSRLLNWVMWALVLILGIYIVLSAGRRFWKMPPKEAFSRGLQAVQLFYDAEAARFLYPGFFWEYEEEPAGTELDWYFSWALAMHPLYKLQRNSSLNQGLENAATYEMLVSGGAQDESETDENGEEYDVNELAEAENAQALQEKAQEELRQEEQNLDLAMQEQEMAPQAAGTIYNLEELSDFDFLLGSFYTVENNTTISPEDLNAEKLLSKDMSIDKNTDGPQILVYHTHSQEGFVDSVPGDNSTTIVGVGEYLVELLREKGYDVMHVTSVYDLVDGKLDRNEAYSKAQAEISQILEQYPSIQSVIDLHRDGVAEGTRLVTEIDGKTVAKFMFFNGLSRTKKNGPIEYLYNPYIEDNLALTLQLKLQCEQYYPGLARNIYLKSLRYNLHLSDKALLIEVGAQTNTLQEVMNTMEPLADVLDKVFD